MKPKVAGARNTEAVKQYTLRLADDALILGHRLSEWCGNAPSLEEELALANTALDFLGQARMLYGYAAELAGGTVSEDSYAYTRDCREFSNLLICELPKGDFAFTMARQYLLDEFYVAFMRALQDSADPTLAAIAGKAVKECGYHLRNSREWMLRLGDGTEESKRRLQNAVNDLWGYTEEMFTADDLVRDLLARNIAVDSAALAAGWEQAVAATLTEAGIMIPERNWSVSGGRSGVHTEHLGHLLSELQFMQRAYPGLEW